jgi:hypothetical protein
MTVLALIIACVALVVASVALGLAIKNKNVKTIVEKETVNTVAAPVEHPFTYNEKDNVYTLDGNFKAEGGIIAMGITKKKEE